MLNDQGQEVDENGSPVASYIRAGEPDPNGGAPRPPAPPSGSPNYDSQIRDQYQKSLGRAPTDAELASDSANAAKYGIKGSLLGDIAARGSNTPGVGDRQGGNSMGASGSSQGAQGAPQYQNDLIKQMMDRQATQDAQQRQRGDNLYNLLNERANQGLNVNRNDPVIRAQADAFSANQDRAARNLNSDVAERGGQYANIEGTRRMSAEHAGQASGAFEANLMGQEVAAKRQEIAQALSGQAGLLTADQQNQLQRQLGLLDQSIKQQQIGLGQQGINQDWQRALLSNEQFNNQLGLNAQQFQAQSDWNWGH